MKRLCAYCLVVAFAAGCSQKQTAKETDSNEPVANVPVVTPGANNELPPGSTPPKQPGKTTPAPSQTRIQGGNSFPPSTPPRSIERPKRENPNAGPPKPGEEVAHDFKIQVGSQTVEIEGVCKLTEEEAMCWRPNGEKNDSLATELTNAIKSKTDSYSNTFQFKFMKKNRILVMKTTTAPMKPGDTGRNYSSYGAMTDYGGGEFTEGWTNNNSIFSGSSSTGFDQSRIERQVFSGAFNKETKSYPFRYQATNFNPERQSVPFAKGPFTIDGNTYEITSISDKPSVGAYTPYVQPGQKPPKNTFVTFKVVKITNPNSVVNLMPSDDSGTPYGGLNDKGDPISAAEAQKLREEESRKMMEASRTGKPYMTAPRMMNNYVNGIGLDPRTISVNGRDTFTSAFNIEAGKIKKLGANVSRRTVFVFDKIKLDQN